MMTHLVRPREMKMIAGQLKEYSTNVTCRLRNQSSLRGKIV